VAGHGAGGTTSDEADTDPTGEPTPRRRGDPGDSAAPGVGATAPPTWRRLLVDAAVLFGLAGVAITQPLLDLFGNNPTFFVAGNYGRRKIVLFALVVALVPAVVVFVMTTLVGLTGRRAGAIAHGAGVALFAGLFGLVVCRTLGVDAALVALAIALALGVGVALVEARTDAARRFLTYLALGNVAFVALFGLASPTAELLQGTYTADGGNVTVPDLQGPVTVLVLDEFPLTALLRPDGTLNEVRYPNIAALAEESTWFRNASAELPTTYLSVPSVMSGMAASTDDLPIYRDHPRNLLSLFGARYPINAYEPVTDLCPPDACGRPPGEPLSQALSDASVVYRHRVLPGSMRDGLPAVDQGWGSFGGGVGDDGEDGATGQGGTTVVTTSSGEADPMGQGDGVTEADKGRVGQAGVLMRQVRSVSGAPSINFVHVLLPHHPYELTPWGVVSTDTWLPRKMPEPGDPNFERAFAEVYAMQAMQVGAVDRMIGEIVGHLKATGAWDTGTFVLTSDHGIDVTAPRFSRSVRPDNEDGILRIPLFIRAPGQTPGEVRDEPATTLDVLPSLIDVLGVETDWDMDGHSLFDGSEPDYERALTTDFEEGLDYVATQQEHLRAGDDWTSVVAIGDQGDLVGTAVADHRVGADSALSWSYQDAAALADPATAGGRAPVLMSGRVQGGDGPPPDLVVALDGVISGTIGGFVDTDEGWAFTGLLGPEVEGGADEVVAYEVERDGATVTLHPLVA